MTDEVTKVYTSHAVTTKISAISRVAVKIRDNFYTVEFSEERSLPDDPEVNLSMERQLLFDDINALVDNQVREIYSVMDKNKKK